MPWESKSAALMDQKPLQRPDLKPYSQTDLDAIAAELTGHPRLTLQFMTPSEKIAALLQPPIELAELAPVTDRHHRAMLGRTPDRRQMRRTAP